ESARKLEQARGVGQLLDESGAGFARGAGKERLDFFLPRACQHLVEIERKSRCSASNENAKGRGCKRARSLFFQAQERSIDGASFCCFRGQIVGVSSRKPFRILVRKESGPVDIQTMVDSRA